MKKYLTQLFLLLAIFFTSCGGSSFDACKTEDMKTINNTINEILPANAKTRSAYLFYSTTYSTIGTNVNNINVYYDESDGNHKFANIQLDNKEKSEIKDDNNYVEPFGDKNPRGRDITNYDFTIVSTNLNKAIDILKEEDILISGFENYIIDYYEDPQFDKHRFTLLSKAGDAKLKGRRLETEYYVISCVADADGNITFPDIE